MVDHLQGKSLNKSKSFILNSWGFPGGTFILTPAGYFIYFDLLGTGMQSISYIITWIGTLVLLASGAAWWNAFRTRQLAHIAGRLELEQDTRRANSAAIVTVAAFSLSVVAAILAIIAWLR
jgi:hypothetical protein